MSNPRRRRLLPDIPEDDSLDLAAEQEVDDIDWDSSFDLDKTPGEGFETPSAFATPKQGRLLSSTPNKKKTPQGKRGKGLKPFKCSKCRSCFVSQNNLNEQQKKHQWEGESVKFNYALQCLKVRGRRKHNFLQ